MCVFKNKVVSHVLLVFLVAVLSLLPVFASEGSDPDTVDGLVSVDIPIVSGSQTLVQPIVVQVEPPDTSEIVSAIGDMLMVSDADDVAVPDDWELVGVTSYAVTPLYDLDNGSVTTANGLKAIVRRLIGDYNAVVVQYQYHANGNSNYTYVNQIQPDYEWLCSCGIFSLMLFCTFRLGGALLRKT